MVPVLFVAFIVVPIVELYVIVRVGVTIGWLPTIGLLVGISVLGTYLLKQQGIATWRRLRTTLQAGRMPAQEVIDGALILFGGALLLTPGFVTDALGLLLLLPPSRAVVKRSMRGLLARAAVGRTGPAGRAVYEARVVRTRPASPGSRTLPEEAEASGPDDAGGSPGRG